MHLKIFKNNNRTLKEVHTHTYTHTHRAPEIFQRSTPPLFPSDQLIIFILKHLYIFLNNESFKGKVENLRALPIIPFAAFREDKLTFRLQMRGNIDYLKFPNGPNSHSRGRGVISMASKALLGPPKGGRRSQFWPLPMILKLSRSPGQKKGCMALKLQHIHNYNKGGNYFKAKEVILTAKPKQY